MATNTLVTGIIPRVGSRLFDTLLSLVRLSRQNRYSNPGNDGHDRPFQDDISRLSNRGWRIETTTSKSGYTRYRISPDQVGGSLLADLNKLVRDNN